MRPLLSILAAAALLGPQRASACPAIPIPVEVSQPGGSSFLVEVRGDEHRHFVREASTGYTVVQSEDGVWWYAAKGAGGRLVPSSHRVGDIDPALAGLSKGIAPEATPRRHEGVPAGAVPRRPSARLAKAGSLGLPPATEIIALMCQFPGTSGVNSQAYWTHMLFGANASLADYYDEVSYGRFAVSGAVHGWRTLPQALATYDASDPSLWARMIADAIATFDPYVDFAGYDDDGDGLVDHLLLICAGDDPSDGSGSGIWPHMSWTGAPVATADGVEIGSYFLVDDYTFSSDHRASLGTLCHEFGHNLAWPMGFADLYDPDFGSLAVDDDNNYPVRHWCLMGEGNWAGPTTSTLGAVPAHPSGFHRMYAGWLDPVTITAGGTRTLSPIEGTSGTRLIKVPVAAKPQEFFLLEFRKPIASAAYDRYSNWCSYGGDFPRIDPGLLVTRVDSTMWARAVTNAANLGTDTYASYSVEAVDSGFRGYGGPSCPDTVLTYSEARTSAPFSVEDGATGMAGSLSECFDGSSSGIELSAIGAGAGSTISFTLARSDAAIVKRLLLHDDSFPLGAFNSTTGTLRAVKFSGPSGGSGFAVSRAYLCLYTGLPAATFRLRVMTGNGTGDLIPPFPVTVAREETYPLWKEVDLSAFAPLQNLAPGTEFRVAIEYTAPDQPYVWFDPFAGDGRSYQKAPAGPWQLSASGGEYVDYMIRVDVATNGVVPVTLTSFDARAVAGGVRLDWSVADAANHAGFRVYRAAGQTGDWQGLGKGLVESANGRYTYLDLTVTPGEHYRYRLGEVARDGAETWMGMVEIDVPRLLAPRVAILAIEPNPAPGAIRVSVEASWAGWIRLEVFDPSGRRLRTLADKLVPGGKLGFEWDGKDEAGRLAGSGVYLVRLQAGDQVESEKVTLVR